MNQQALSAFIWSVADLLRGDYKQTAKQKPWSWSVKALAGQVQEKEKAYLAEIIAKVNDLFDGELSDDDQINLT